MSDARGGNGQTVLCAGQAATKGATGVVRVDRRVKAVKENEFWHREDLVEVDLCDGLERIGKSAFEGCKQLRRVGVPSAATKDAHSVTASIRRFVTGLNKIKKQQQRRGRDVRKIERNAFGWCAALSNIKLPPNIEVIDGLAFWGCEQLVSVELHKGTKRIYKSAFRGCTSLRNIKIPTAAKAPNCFERCYDLLRVFGTQRRAVDGLKRRFDGLPVHSICYCHPDYEPEITLKHLKDAIMPFQNGTPSSHESIIDSNQDCIGFTPLHLLACSTKHVPDLYHFIIDQQPLSLVTLDKWGSPPILYAIWTDAPHEIVQLLARSHQSSFPNIDLNWNEMFSTLCMAGSLGSIGVLLHTRQTFFPEQSIDWQKAARELAIRYLYRRSSYLDKPPSWDVMMERLGSVPTHPDLIERLLEIQQEFFADRNVIDWQRAMEEFAKPLEGWWLVDYPLESEKIFQFLVRSRFGERCNAIGVRELRTKARKLALSPIYRSVDAYFDAVHAGLVSYERKYAKLKDLAFLLEIIVWKNKIGEAVNGSKRRGQIGRDAVDVEQVRATCGAGVVIPNVLAFLIDD